MGRVPPDLAGPRGRAGPDAARGRGDDRPSDRRGRGSRVRLGRADLHIHTPRVGRRRRRWPRSSTTSRPQGFLDVIAITDHERIDAALAARHMAADRGLPFEVVVGEEITTRGGHLLGLFLERPIPALKGLRWSIEAVHDQGGIAIPAHPLVPYPLCAQGPMLRRLLAARRPRRPARRDRDVQPHGARPVPPRRRRPVRRRARPGRSSATATRTSPTRSAPAGRRSRAGPRRTCRRAIAAARDRATTAASTARSGSSGVFGRQLRKYAARLAGGRRRARPARRHRSRPRLPRRHAAPAALRSRRRGRTPAREDRARLAVRVPAAGRRDPARPLPVREPPAARPRRPDPDLVARPPARRPRATSSASARASRCRPTARSGPSPSRPASCPRPATCSSRERFDVLHFHEPFVPFLSLVLLRESQSVNIGTFHAYGGWSPAYEFGRWAMGSYAERLHGRIAVSAAARHFIDRYFPGDYKVIPNGVDVDRFRRAVPRRALAGRDAQHPVRRAVRAPQGRPGPAQGVPDLAQDRLRLPAAARGRRAAGARGAALRRDPAAARRRVPGPRDGRREGQLFRTPTSTCSPATGRESFGIVLLEAMAAGAPIVASDIHGYKGVVRRGREALLVEPREPKELAAAIGRLLGDRELAAHDVGGRRAARRGVQLAAGDRQGRRLLRVRDPAPRRGRAPCRRTSRRRCRRRRGRRRVPRGDVGPAPEPAPSPQPGASGRARLPGPAGVGALLGLDRPAPAATTRSSRRRPRRRPPAPATSSANAGVGERDRAAPVEGVHGELERVQVGRQQALVGVDDRRRHRQRRDVRVQDHEPRARPRRRGPGRTGARRAR